MTESVVAQETVEKNELATRYHRVEVSLNGNTPYIFKIWNTAQSSSCILVKEDSDISPCFNVGDTLQTIYYDKGSAYPNSRVTSRVRHVSRNIEGRFKGHALVSLEIMPDNSHQ